MMYSDNTHTPDPPERRSGRAEQLRSATCRNIVAAFLGPAYVLIYCYSSLAQGGDPVRPFESFTKPFRSIEVAAADPGRVASVAIHRGDVVKTGQTLLMLDAKVLEANRKVVAAEAAGIAKIDALKIEHDLKLRRLKQFEALSEDGHGSSEELLRAKADEQIASANLRAEKELREQRQLKVEEIETRIAAKRITSPIDGIVTDVKKEPGEFVSGAAPEVATIVDLTQLRASFFLPTEAAAELIRNQPVGVLLLQAGRTVNARVEHVGVVTEADSGRVRVDVVMHNGKQQLRSGVRCRLILTTEATNDSQRSARVWDGPTKKS